MYCEGFSGVQLYGALDTLHHSPPGYPLASHFAIPVSWRYRLQNSPTSPQNKAPSGAKRSARNRTKGERFHREICHMTFSATPLFAPVFEEIVFMAAS